MSSQGWFRLELTGLISLLLKGLQKSSPAPEFKSIKSSVLSLLCCPTLTSVPDYWKSHSFFSWFFMLNIFYWSFAFFFFFSLLTLSLAFSYLLLTPVSYIHFWCFCEVMSLLFNMLSSFIIAFFPRSKCLLISWLQSPSAVILEPQKIKSFTVSTFSPSIYHEVMGLDAMVLVFWMLSFKPAFSLSSFIFIKRLFSSSWSCVRAIQMMAGILSETMK